MLLNKSLCVLNLVLQHKMEKAKCLSISVNMAWNTCTSTYQTPCHYIAVVSLNRFYSVWRKGLSYSFFFVITVIYSWIRTHLIIINIDIKTYKWQSKHNSFIIIYYFRATCFDSLESSSGPLMNWPKTVCFLVHSGIP